MPKRKAKRLSPEEVSLQGEIDYIVAHAQKGAARIVRLGKLVFFSMENGDAWMLDPEESYAACLADEGIPVPVLFEENESKMIISWPATYTIDSDVFVVRENKSGDSTRLPEYPIRFILEAAEQL